MVVAIAYSLQTEPRLEKSILSEYFRNREDIFGLANNVEMYLHVFQK